VVLLDADPDLGTGLHGTGLALARRHALLIGARRPTVTLALQRLARSGSLLREGPGRWLLTKGGIDCLRHPESIGLVTAGTAESGGAGPVDRSGDPDGGDDTMGL
jgi:hypothetical protein